MGERGPAREPCSPGDSASQERRSLKASAFPGRAWERVIALARCLLGRRGRPVRGAPPRAVQATATCSGVAEPIGQNPFTFFRKQRVEFVCRNGLAIAHTVERQTVESSISRVGLNRIMTLTAMVDFVGLHCDHAASFMRRLAKGIVP